MQGTFLSNQKDLLVYRLVLLNSGDFERQCRPQWTKQVLGLHINQMKKSKSKRYLTCDLRFFSASSSYLICLFKDSLVNGVFIVPGCNFGDINPPCINLYFLLCIDV